jgi:hypothetical protein
MVKNRPHGLVYARENCYGWHGPWQHRSGWQQISDAVCNRSTNLTKSLVLLTFAFRSVVFRLPMGGRWDETKQLPPSFQTQTTGRLRASTLTIYTVRRAKALQYWNHRYLRCLERADRAGREGGLCLR